MSEKHVPAELRRLVVERAKGYCEYCGAQADYSHDPFPVDHIIPRGLGGPTSAENLAYCCFGCNQHESVRVSASDPATESIVPLFHPRRDRWKEHFAWNDDFTLRPGLTPIGRAAIEALQLNRLGLVNLRRALYAIGEHPPELNN